MKPCFQALADQGIAPVIALGKTEYAVPLAQALRRGGLNNLELTLRTDAALESISLIKKAFPDMTVSAGTVLSRENVDAAVGAGADFVVTPGFNPEVVGYCCDRGIGIIPGCTTASEIDRALTYGLTVLKFYPAVPNGGLEAIELLAGPFKQVKFLPTGGMTYDNIGAYLRSKAVIACGGSYMAKTSLVEAQAWDTIADNCRKAMDLSLGFELAHVGVNHEDEESAVRSGKTMAEIFRMPLKIGNSSVFAGTAVEHMKKNYLGTHGHIGFYTSSVARAKAYFEANGIRINEESIRLDAKGEKVSFYLADEEAGFALHVVKR